MNDEDQLDQRRQIENLSEELTAIRRDIHQHPETAYEEKRTADIVAARLDAWGLEVHRGLGGTGVVGTLRKGDSNRAVGFRADMDALFIQEKNTFEHRSVDDGKMHACGHDGHTTMLLGAARYLSQISAFNGVLHFIFQPAEEGEAGAKAMIDDGLFDLFPCDDAPQRHRPHDRGRSVHHCDADDRQPQYGSNRHGCDQCRAYRWR
jgi:hippurate hydrolase